ncbi:MAG: NAD(P)(+) transhydrogenase (Re/Si-specific) subunit alpha, partial [Aestuariibacter sp.]|nr:NAD(P)(+) transhydrogenase (Re/Si-specific) subunit alpha [Aestuariibacter sp.]
MKIGVLKEIHAGEKRVATTPDITEKLLKLGFEVVIQAGAGEAANFSDKSYLEAGASICKDAKTICDAADVLIKVRAPQENFNTEQHEIELIRRGCNVISFIWPAQNEGLLKQLAEHGITTLAMDSIPRIFRAQKLDALSSMANIAGYRAVVEASSQFGRFFSGQITAAGKV